MKEEVKLEVDAIFFPFFSKRYGRTMFEFCPVFKRGRLERLYIDPITFPSSCIYVVEYKSDDFIIDSWAGLDTPDVWKMLWCKEHKTIAMQVYAPNESTHLYITRLLNLSVHFGGKKQHHIIGSSISLEEEV